MRPLALALVFLYAATSVEAVPVTSYATGVVTEDRSEVSPNFPVYSFAVGERVWVEFIIDGDPGPGYPFPAFVAVNLFTEGGFRKILKSNSLLPGTSEGSTGDGGGSLYLAQTDRSIRLSAGPLGGSIEYSRDAGPSSQGFVGSLELIDVGDMPVPEPSTGVLGAIGVGVLGLAGGGRKQAIIRAA